MTATPRIDKQKGKSVLKRPPTLEINNLPRLVNSPEIVEKLREVVIKHRFSKLFDWDDATGRTKYAKEIDAHALKRHDYTIQIYLPWVWQVFDLNKKTKVVEIGCGTGSSTAAFAPYVGEIIGYDIDARYVEAATDRMKVQGLENASIHCYPPNEVNQKILKRHKKERADIVLLFAVLEHQTIAERLDTLNMAQQIVADGGIIVVAETPNRLCYQDMHTSVMPFFHMLPYELKQLYYNRSPRKNFKESVTSFLKQKELTQDKIEEYFIRWGDCVSFHEFELTFKNIHQRIIADGFHPNLIRLRGIRKEDEILQEALHSFLPDVHPAFSRHYLDLIIQC